MSQLLPTIYYNFFPPVLAHLISAPADARRVLKRRHHIGCLHGPFECPAGHASECPEQSSASENCCCCCPEVEGGLEYQPLKTLSMRPRGFKVVGCRLASAILQERRVGCWGGEGYGRWPGVLSDRGSVWIILRGTLRQACSHGLETCADWDCRQ